MHSFQWEKNLPALNITCNNNRIKQFCVVKYLGCCVEASLVENPWRWNLLRRSMQSYIQNEFLNPGLRRFLCNSLIQPHSDYACVSWCLLVREFKKISFVLQSPQGQISNCQILILALNLFRVVTCFISLGKRSQYFWRHVKDDL